MGKLRNQEALAKHSYVGKVIKDCFSKASGSQSATPGLNLRLSVSNKFPSEADAAEFGVRGSGPLMKSSWSTAGS